MRDEKEGRKKQARSNKQTRQSNTAHPRQSLVLAASGGTLDPRHYTLDRALYHVYTVCILMRDEEGRKKEASKVKQTKYSTPKAVTFPKKNELPRMRFEPTTLYIHCIYSIIMYMYQINFPTGNKRQLNAESSHLFLLLPGIQLLKELLDHTRQSALKEGVSAYNALQSYFITASPSRTLYLLEVLYYTCTYIYTCTCICMKVE